jgi:hypothetical protein
MATIVPLTIQTVVQNGQFSDNSYLVLGSNGFNPPANATIQNSYWALVVDRISLNVVQNFIFSDNQDVPSQLAPYTNNSQYMLILTTDRLQSNNLPTGPLYDLLTSLGANTELNRLEQIYNTLSCGTWGNFGYSLVAIMDGSVGLESSNYQDALYVTTLQLIPVNIGTQTMYTPIRL